MRVIGLLFYSSLLFGQTLHLSSAAASRGDTVAIQVSLDSPAGHEPVGLQWETIVPTLQLTPDNNGMVIGPAGQESGKSIQCAGKRKSPEEFSYRCILIGGQKPIKNGTVAMLTLHISPKGQAGAVRIHTQEGIAVTANMKQVKINDSESTVNIRSK